MRARKDPASITYFSRDFQSSISIEYLTSNLFPSYRSALCNSECCGARLIVDCSNNQSERANTNFLFISNLKIRFGELASMKWKNLYVLIYFAHGLIISCSLLNPIKKKGREKEEVRHSVERRRGRGKRSRKEAKLFRSGVITEEA